MSPAPILPGSTIGILGGGQLGRMMALAAREMGYRVVTLDPAPHAPAAPVADAHIVAAYDDRAAADRLAGMSDVVTWEFENVDAGLVQDLSAKAYLPQGHALLATTQHRAREKDAVQAAGAQVAPWEEVTSADGFRMAVARLGTPCVLKTATGGYDGKGQRVLAAGASAFEIDGAYADLGGRDREMVLEAFVPFSRELSVVVARGSTGETVAFPPTENVHVDSILRRSIAPARVQGTVASEAVAIATQIAEDLDAVGVLGVEMFLLESGDLLVNELAPRPHNSGHWTMDGCATGQFEQHVRAICGLPLGPPRQLTPAVMANVLGEHLAGLRAWMAAPDVATGPAGALAAKVHLYGKAEARPGRKMGHVNVLAPSVEDALAWVDTVPIWR